MSENVKFIMTEINKLLGRNYNLIGFNTLSAEDLLQVYNCCFIILLHFSLNLIYIYFFFIDFVQCSTEDTTTR